MVVQFCLNYQFHRSQGLDWHPIKGLEGNPPLVDVLKNANPFGYAFKYDIYFWSIIYQDTTNHNIRDLPLKDKSVIAGRVNSF